MTPIDQQLREKWEKEAREHYINYSYTTTHMIEAYVDGCLARHREYQERVATLEGLVDDVADWYASDQHEMPTDLYKRIMNPPQQEP